jgi:flavin reductase (DIM6/NTAB) family NADH-FMN oxidoreductase RutF
MHPIDTKQFRRTMGLFASGVTVVTFQGDDGLPVGMTVNAFMSVSLTPPLVLVSIRSSSGFCRCIRIGDRYGVSLLSEQQQSISAHFGGRPDSGLASPYVEHQGHPVVRDALAHIVARVSAIHEAGDHLLFVGEVECLADQGPSRPLLFFGGLYRRLDLEALPA